MARPNFYQILDVGTNASIEEIKKAYRNKAFEHHPDHGGTDAEMKLVNEAWEILSNPEARMAFDAEMVNPNNQETQRRGQKNKARAQQKAAAYPKVWEDFEKYLEDLLNDVKDAEYSTEYITLKGLKLSIPSSSNSYSALLFIAGGGCLGLVIMIFFFGFFSPGSIFVTVATGFIAAGAWGGYFLHMLIKNEVKGK